jgi:ribosome-binding protein aMBF1 (putative translation factor)
MTEKSTTIDRLITRLREAKAKQRLTKMRMADMADLHPNTLADFDRPTWKPSIHTLSKLEIALLPEPDAQQCDDHPA